MYNETTGTDVSKKDKKETFEEFIARKKKEFLTEKSVIKPPLFESLRGVPFGSSGLSIMEARLWNEMMNAEPKSIDYSPSHELMVKEGDRSILSLKKNPYFDENAKDG